MIRRASEADADAILACLAAAFEPYRTSYTPGAFVDTVLTKETVLQRLSLMSIYVAVAANHEIAGTIACAKANDTEGHLRGMAVLPHCLGRGIAKELLRTAENELACQGCSRITLDTTPPLQRAMRFYEKHGYRRSGKTVDFFGMPLHEYVKEVPPR
jgi:ribosomal protein S18 acetylase RimI-like enzyme